MVPRHVAAEQVEKVAACGPPGKQAWLCSTVYDLTGSARAAEIGDDLARRSASS